MKKGCQNEVETINGKEYKPWHFKPGNKAATVCKGQPKVSTVIAQSLQIKDLKGFKVWARTYGISRVMAIMEQMKDEEFLKVFIAMLPFCLPRISAIPYRDDLQDNIRGNNSKHIIYVKEMSTGKVSVIQDN